MTPGWVRALLDLPPAASTMAGEIDALHVFVITATMLIAAFVFASAAWFTIRYRRRREGQLTERYVATRGHEVLLIGSVVGVFLLWWVIGFRQYVRMTTAPADADAVYVTAKQWMWKFTYPDGRAANDTLTVVVNRPVKLVMTSRDVIHSFYVPAFRAKQDVIPGRYVTLWFEPNAPGLYPIYCAEYCGVSHSLMRGAVQVLSPEDYDAWKRGTAPAPMTASALADEGRKVAERRACVACHTLDGQRHVGPTWSRLFGSERVLSDGRRVVADEAYLTRSMMEPNADVVAGFPSVMPTYEGTLTPAEAGALVELIKSLRDGPSATAGVALPTLHVTSATLDGGTSP